MTNKYNKTGIKINIIKNKHKQDNNSEYHYDYNLKQLK